VLVGGQLCSGICAKTFGSFGVNVKVSNYNVVAGNCVYEDGDGEKKEKNGEEGEEMRMKRRIEDDHEDMRKRIYDGRRRGERGEQGERTRGEMEN
jgi:hypothetical protein